MQSSKKLSLLLTTLAGLVVLNSCTTPGQKTAIGAGIGVAAGAAAGVLLSKKGDRKKGALMGAAAGGLIGGGVGNYFDKQAKELEKIAETKRTEDGIVTQLKSDLTFDSGSSALKAGGGSQVSELAAILKKYPQNIITIVGHTDNTGKDTFNQTLSQARAEAVKAGLVTGGVAAASISTVGAAASQPVADNGSADGRAKNRRVEIQITVAEESK